MDPRGRTALVSGGTSGLGLAAARLLVATQANVAVLGIGQVAEAAASLGPDVLGLETDIADRQRSPRRWIPSSKGSALRGLALSQAW
jgi:NAD(P)-dependent dehydrogenase (short-subunit alcohol dehydrogenase family)